MTLSNRMCAKRLFEMAPLPRTGPTRGRKPEKTASCRLVTQANSFALRAGGRPARGPKRNHSALNGRACSLHGSAMACTRPLLEIPSSLRSGHSSRRDERSRGSKPGETPGTTAWMACTPEGCQRGNPVFWHPSGCRGIPPPTDRGSQLRCDLRLLSNNITTRLGAMAYKIRQKPHFERELAKLLSSARRPWAAEVLPSGSPPGCEKRPRPAWYRSGHRLGSNHLGPPKVRVRSSPGGGRAVTVGLWSENV